MSRRITITGTIRIERQPSYSAPWDGDDSTLDLVLASFARHGTLAESQQDDALSVQMVSARRLSWPAPTGADRAVCTNLLQLLDDLEAEFERVAG